MPNLHRGEIEAILDGRPHKLCLTLGALAELEAAFGDEDMLALSSRFASGRLSAKDAIRILGSGLRGAGHDITNDMVAGMRTESGAAGFVQVVARLLSATFGTSHAAGEEDEPATDPADVAEMSVPEEGAPVPFPGRR